MLPRKKGSLSRKIQAYYYTILKRSRYFKGNARQLYILKLDYILAQLNLNQDIPFLFVAIVVGLMTGYVAVVFHDAIMMLSSFCFTGIHALGKVNAIDKYWTFVLPLIPAVGGLLVGLYNAFVVKVRPGHGLASVIKAVAQNDGVIEKNLWFHKSVTSVLSIGTGGGGGPEAPIVQVGAAIGSTIAQ